MDLLAAKMPRPFRSRFAVILLMVSDAAALCAALLLSFALRFDGNPVASVYAAFVKQHVVFLPFVLVGYIGIFCVFRLYRYSWRFAGLETLKGVVLANTVGVALLVGVQLATRGGTFPRSVLIIYWLTSVALVGGLRVLLRLASLGATYGGHALRLIREDLAPKRVVILGGGGEGARLLDALREEDGPAYHVLGFLDDKPERSGVYIRDVRVIGQLNHLYTLLEENKVDEVLVAVPNGETSAIRSHVMACRQRKIPVKVVPPIEDLLNGNSHPQIEDFGVEDLLRRPCVRTNIARTCGYLTGKTVLVTGAGGSIGSELCRQIVGLNPRQLILLGHGENSIHRIHCELIRGHPECADSLRMVIASVADDTRIQQVFEDCRPDVVFHTAAHKHVPIMESNVIEAVHNNVVGTANVAEECGRCGVDRMVLISSDKAANPASVMGATKWCCEEIVRAIAEAYPQTGSVTGRFGTVLGSRGSVVPLFHEQITRGGPVTVTHPEMTRYFMSIPEAVHLVLQAGAIGASRDLYVLDMGEPVKVVDLAKDMIRLCGHEPEVDIPIVFTGIRPGEKVNEELTTEQEIIAPSACEGLLVVHRPEYFENPEIPVLLRRVRDAVARGDASDMLNLLADSVPGSLESSVIQGSHVAS